MMSGERHWSEDVGEKLYQARTAGAEWSVRFAAISQEASARGLVSSPQYDETWVESGFEDVKLPPKFWTTFPDRETGGVALTEFSIQFPINNEEELVNCFDALRVLAWKLDLAKLNADIRYALEYGNIGLDLLYEHLRGDSK